MTNAGQWVPHDDDVIDVIAGTLGILSSPTYQVPKAKRKISTFSSLKPHRSCRWARLERMEMRKVAGHILRHDAAGVIRKVHVIWIVGIVSTADVKRKG